MHALNRDWILQAKDLFYSLQGWKLHFSASQEGTLAHLHEVEEEIWLFVD